MDKDALDKSLKEVRDTRPKEVELETITEDPELEEFGERLHEAFLASGEAPPLAALEYLDEAAKLPEPSRAEVDRVTARLQERLRSRLTEQTGAASAAEVIAKAASRAGMPADRLAAGLGLAPDAARSLVAGRMPIWRVSARRCAQLCVELAVERRSITSWLLVSAPHSGPSGVYGRLDAQGQHRTEQLRALGESSAEELTKELQSWAQEFNDAYESASGGDGLEGPQRERPD